MRARSRAPAVRALTATGCDGGGQSVADGPLDPPAPNRPVSTRRRRTGYERDAVAGLSTLVLDRS